MEAAEKKKNINELWAESFPSILCLTLLVPKPDEEEKLT